MDCGWNRERRGPMGSYLHYYQFKEALQALGLGRARILVGSEANHDLGNEEANGTKGHELKVGI